MVHIGDRLGMKPEGGGDCTVKDPEGLEDWEGLTPGIVCEPVLASFSAGQLKQRSKNMCGLLRKFAVLASEGGRGFPGRGCLDDPGCGPALGWSSYLVEPAG